METYGIRDEEKIERFLIELLFEKLMVYPVAIVFGMGSLRLFAFLFHLVSDHVEIATTNVVIHTQVFEKSHLAQTGLENG